MTCRWRSRAGSLTALLGPSGSGKSTLLRIIAGLETADEGAVFIEEKNVTGRPPQERGVGFVFQHYAAFKHMTVYDNVAFGLKIRKRPKAEIEERVHQLLKLVQLEGLAKRYPSQLSGGQRQRMGLARALAIDPAVLLLDEPFGALDARVRAELRDWLRRLHDETHTTTVIVTHDQEEAMEVADQVAVMSAGKIEQVGSPRDVYEQPANEFVMTFVGQAHQLGDTFVRPHDLEVTLEPNGSTREVMIDRIVHLGFNVRLELVGRRRRAALGADDARPCRAARVRLRPDRLRPADAPHDVHVAGPPRGADERATMSASVVCSRTSRIADRRSSQTGCSPAAAPTYSTSSGRAPRTVAIGPSTARITSATEISAGRPRERIAALDAPLARDELLVAKLDEDALEELPRDRLRGRELLPLHERPRGRELEHRAEGVVDLGGDAHRGTVSRTPRQSPRLGRDDGRPCRS